MDLHLMNLLLSDFYTPFQCCFESEVALRNNNCLIVIRAILLPVAGARRLYLQVY